VALAATTIAGGADNDVFNGSVSVGTGGVSFWGGTGNDSFNFTAISNASSTAYFWNDQVGTDTIVFKTANAYGSTTNFGFGITQGSALQIDLGASQTASFFSGNAISRLFSLSSTSSNATVIYSSTAITLDYADGTSIIFSGNEGMTVGFGTTFNEPQSGGINTINFGTANISIPTFS